MTVVSRTAQNVVYAYDRSDPLDPRIVASFTVPDDLDDHAVSPALTSCVVATGGELLSTGAAGWRLGGKFVACAFAPDGATVWAYAPGRWVTLDARTGAVLAERSLDPGGPAGVMIEHPSGELLLDVIERTYRSGGGGFDWTDRALIAASPDGSQLMTVGHDQADAAFHAWPDGRVLARCHLADLEWSGGYLTADTAVVVTSAVVHHTVDTRTGQVTGELAVTTIDPYDLQPMGDGTFLTTDTDGRLRGHG